MLTIVQRRIAAPKVSGSIPFLPSLSFCSFPYHLHGKMEKCRCLLLAGLMMEAGPVRSTRNTVLAIFNSF